MSQRSSRIRSTFLVLIVAACALGVVLRRTHWPLAPGLRDRMPAVAAAPAEADVDPLVVLNQSFRKAYQRGRAEMLAQAGPVILVEGDTLVLLHQGQRTEVTFIPPAYDSLKAVSHVPLALYVLLAPFGEGPLSDERLADLHHYRELIVAAQASLEKHGLTADTLVRQQQILKESLAFLDGVVQQRQASRDEVTGFTKRMAPLLLADADEAARREIDALNAQTTAWRRRLTADEWRQLHVIVVGSAMPRKGNLAVQYYARLLGEPGEGPRLIYAEALWDETKARDLLGTHLLDTRIGADFFGDPQRMHRDLLDDAAATYLKQLALEP